MFDHLVFRRCTWDEVPWDRLVVTTLWVDPAVTKTDRSDSYGIQGDALSRDGTLYRLYSWEQRATLRETLTRAILKALELGASFEGVETDQGGDTWRHLYHLTLRLLHEQERIAPGTVLPRFVEEKAGA